MIVKKVKLVKDLTWVYGILGVLLLAAVFLFAQVSGGTADEDHDVAEYGLKAFAELM